MRWALSRASRSFRSRPGLRVACILLLGVAVGFQMTIIGVFWSVMVAPLPFGDASRLATVYVVKDGVDWDATVGDYFDWRAVRLPFSALAAYASADPALLEAPDPKALQVFSVSSSLLRTIGTRPVRGRFFLDREEGTETPVAVLTHAGWTTAFGRRDDIVGSQITLDGRSYNVIGIAPPEVRLLLDGDVLVPFEDPLEGRGRRSVQLVVRLAPGVTMSQAQAAVSRLVAAGESKDPANEGFRSARVVPLKDRAVGDTRAPAAALVLLAALVFVAVTANIAGLQAAGSDLLAKGFAIRASLGATWRDLVIDRLADMVPTFVGATCVSALITAALGSIGRGLTTNALAVAGLDQGPWTLAGAIAIAGLAVLLSEAAVTPPLLISSTSVASVAYLHRGGAVLSRNLERAQAALLVAQTFAALLFVVFAFAIAGDIRRLANADPGFQTSGLWCLDVKTVSGQRTERGEQGRLYERLLSAVSTVPGIVAVGAVNSHPLAGPPGSLSLRVEGAPTQRSERVDVRIVSPGYFETMRIGLREGRFFKATDTPSSGLKAVVSQGFVDHYWRTPHALGRRLGVERSPWIEVIGVAGNVRSGDSVASAKPEVYLSTTQVSSSGEMTLVIRTRPDHTLRAIDLRPVIRSVASGLAVGPTRTAQSMLADSRRPLHVTTAFLSAWSSLAVVLAWAGTFSLVSVVVARRRRAIALRRALGASETRLTVGVAGWTCGLVGLGIGAGVAVARLLGRFYATAFVGARPVPATSLAAAALFLGLTLVPAAYYPARRAVFRPIREALASE